MNELVSMVKKLDKGYNLVNLVPLRKAMGWDTQTFNANLMAARRAGLLTCSGAEGRHGITEEERAACLEERGSLLLFVSVRQQY